MINPVQTLAGALHALATREGGKRPVTKSEGAGCCPYFAPGCYHLSGNQEKMAPGKMSCQEIIRTPIILII
jgi:hypothetical protein